MNISASVKVVLFYFYVRVSAVVGLCSVFRPHAHAIADFFARLPLMRFPNVIVQVINGPFLLYLLTSYLHYSLKINRKIPFLFKHLHICFGLPFSELRQLP